MKLKILLLLISISSVLWAQEDPYRNLIISEINIAEPVNQPNAIRNVYVEITNVGNTPVDLAKFKFARMSTEPNCDWESGIWDNGNSDDFFLPASVSKVLEPDSSYVMSMGYDYWLNGYKADLPAFDFRNRDQNYNIYKYADFIAHYPEKPEEHELLYPQIKDSVTTDADSSEKYYMTYRQLYHSNFGFYIQHHFDDGFGGEDSLVIDQIYNTFTNNCRNEGGDYLSIAGVENARNVGVVFRKSTVSQGQLDWLTYRGLTSEDSEWIVIKVPEGSDNWRELWWTIGNHGDFVLDATTLEPKAGENVTVDFSGKTITVPWGTRRLDDIMRKMEYKKGVAWEYQLNEVKEDSLLRSAQNGDKLVVYVVGSTLYVETFDIVVEDPLASDNIVIPVDHRSTDDSDGSAITYNTQAGKLSWPRVTNHASGMDTITGAGKGLPYDLRIDSLYKYLEKAPNASFEIVFVDGQKRADLKEGDKLKVTAENGDVKEYYLQFRRYSPSENAFLASITWPDNELSPVEKFELGWAGDTIPNFSSGSFNYRVELPSSVTSIPALVAKPQDVNAKVKVDPAFTFNGSEEDRTTTFTVTAQNDSVEVYTIVFKKKVAEENMQPFYAEPFIARFQHRRGGGLQNYFMEIVNPGNQPLDLSYYMIASNRFADGPNPNSVIQSFTETDSITWFNRRYAKYIPGRKWPVYSEWNMNPATVEPDPDVTVPRAMLPGGESFLLGQLGDDRHRDPEDPDWPIVDKLDVQFINTEGEYGTYTNNWNEPVHRVGTPLSGQKWGSARFMYKILNDSVRNGLKPATDPDDFELIETLSMADYTSRWVVAGYTMGPVDVQWRKPEYIFPNPIAQASFGTNEEDSEWIVEDRGNDDQAQNEAELGNHFFNPPTMYMSTVKSYLYKVSPGYSDAETIDGITTGTIVATFLSNIYKADEGQTLTVKSYANPGDTLLSDEVISPSDTLVVVSKDGENTTKYILSVTEEGLSADATLSSTEYTVTEDAAAGTGVVAGMALGTTLEEVVSNVSKHEGAVLRIVDENGLDIPYKRLNYMNEYVASTANSDTYFEVTAENYTDKILYQLQPSAGEDEAFIISDVYDVSEETKIIRYIPLGTTLETFRSNIIASPGASYVILDKAGYEKTSGNLAQDDRIIVTSADETVQTIYYLSLIVDEELNQSVPSLAFITSNVYTIDQVTAVIDSVFEGTTVVDFLSNIIPATDAEVVIHDANGDVKTEGALAQDDMVEVTSALGDLSLVYTFGTFKEETGAEAFQADQIKIYPNPTNAHLYIEGLQSGSRIKVYNVTGKLIRDVISTDQRKMISLEGETASLYLIVVSNRNVPNTYFKVIKE